MSLFKCKFPVFANIEAEEEKRYLGSKHIGSSNETIDCNIPVEDVLGNKLLSIFAYISNSFCFFSFRHRMLIC